MLIVYAILGITVLMSISAWQSSELMNRWLMRPYLVRNNNQWYRFITSGFIHADWTHLIFNMIGFYTFGISVYSGYLNYFGNGAIYIFILLYIGGMIVADIPSYLKHKDHSWYASLGASGAVSAVAMASVLLYPLSSIYMMGILRLPAIVWAVIYLVSSQYLAQKGGDNINHSAHFYGALFGIVLTLALKPVIAADFVQQLFSRN